MRDSGSLIRDELHCSKHTHTQKHMAGTKHVSPRKENHMSKLQETLEAVSKQA